MPFAEGVFEALIDLVLLVGEECITVGVPVEILRLYWVNGRACAPAGAVGALAVNVRAAVWVRLTNNESLKSDRYRKLLAPLQLVTLPDQILESFVERTGLRRVERAERGQFIVRLRRY